MSKMYNVVHASGNYVGRDGQERTSWNPVGKLRVNDDGKVSLLLFLTGEWYNCFEQTREDAGAGPASHAGAHAPAPNPAIGPNTTGSW